MSLLLLIADIGLVLLALFALFLADKYIVIIPNSIDIVIAITEVPNIRCMSPISYRK